MSFEFEGVQAFRSSPLKERRKESSSFDFQSAGASKQNAATNYATNTSAVEEMLDGWERELDQLKEQLVDNTIRVSELAVELITLFQPKLLAKIRKAEQACIQCHDKYEEAAAKISEMGKEDENKVSMSEELM